MRILLAAVLILGSASTAFAQRPVPAPQPVYGGARVVVSDGVLRAEMPAAGVPYTTDWPSVMIPARSIKTGADPTVPEFRIRAWHEAEGVRVLVFAVSVSEPSRVVSERQIASVFVPFDKYVDVPATEKYRARRLTLTAYRELVRGSSAPYEVRPHYIDIPVRPWSPPRR